MAVGAHFAGHIYMNPGFSVSILVLHKAIDSRGAEALLTFSVGIHPMALVTRSLLAAALFGLAIVSVFGA